jgi:hypothetical protein
MRTVFKAQHPLFGRANNRQPLSKQQASPYYWWWAFLRRNQLYMDCCNNNGSGELAALYKDFGDVRDDDFRLWWNAHGIALFREQPKELFVKELTSKEEWLDEWQASQVLIVAVPLSLPKNQIDKFFARLLKARHGGQRGRKALSDSDASTARYPLNRNVSVLTLKTQLAVYDAIEANKIATKRKTLSQIGLSLGIKKQSKSSAFDSIEDAESKRILLTATVSRYYKQARLIIAATADGVFPAKV